MARQKQQSPFFLVGTVTIGVLIMFGFGYFLWNDASVTGYAYNLPTAGQNLVAKAAQVTDCAVHFTRVSASRLRGIDGQRSSCSTSSYVEPYGCERKMKLPKNACPRGLKASTVFTFGDAYNNVPSYNCYISQRKEATTPPAGCPINPSLIKCPDGFKTEYSQQALNWMGTGTVVACAFTCNAVDTKSTANWPCQKQGYQAYLTTEHGSYESVCCAKGMK